MSPPHPRAVGSYGPEWADWAAGWDLTPRWWQLLVATRVLEHDQEGLLVWPQWVVSTSRQSGKSILLRLLAMWRLGQGQRFGGPQLVMHTGKDIPVCRQVQRPARAWARRHEGWWAREANGREEVGAPDDSRWLVRAQDAVYGYTVDLGLVDEAWDVRTATVEEGLEPTMPERTSPQLGLLSTAHRRTTDLLPGRRRLALAGQDVLLVEWSAEPGAAVDDRDGWRAASPHWSTGRERLLEQTLARVSAGSTSDPDEPDPLESFRAQWLNVWPGEVVSRAADEPLLGDSVWAPLGDLAATAGGPLLLAVEDWFGLGAAAAACGGLSDGRPLVWGRVFPRREDALRWVTGLAEARPGSRLLAGASMAHDQDTVGVPAALSAAGLAETRTGLALLRDLAIAGDLAHDGGAELAAQVASARVRRAASGLMLTGRAGRSDLLRCVCWVLAARAAEPAPAPRPGWVMV